MRICAEAGLLAQVARLLVPQFGTLPRQGPVVTFLLDDFYSSGGCDGI